MLSLLPITGPYNASAGPTRGKKLRAICP